MSAYVDRELDPPTERAVERHLSACPECAAQAAFELEFQATLRALPAPRLRPEFPANVLHEASAEQYALAAH